MEETTKLDRWMDSGGGNDCGARYHLRNAPELTPEMACLRWRELNLLLHSLALLHTDLEGKKPFLPVLRSSGTIVAARRGLLYLWDENGGGIRLKVGFGLGHRAPERLRATNRMAEAALQIERSEEHTSELQSRLHLVCRLLLAKKKHKGAFRTQHV